MPEKIVIIGAGQAGAQAVQTLRAEGFRGAITLVGEEAYPHVKRMETFQTRRLKILQKEGDDYFPAKNYAEYRWIPVDQFLAVPFVVYGDNLAVILFEPEPTIIINNYPLVAEAYRLQFLSLWDNAIVPPQQLVDKSVIPNKYIAKSQA